ncbi:MAG TPA: NAD(P)-binding protein [Acidimicrobiales bacterium]|nr:NAD(P)-binding protein [Acidimicrobiales bacterium]
MPDNVVIVGAGRAALTAAHALARRGHTSTPLEVTAAGRDDPAA